MAFPLLMVAQAVLDTVVGDRELLAQWRYDESRRIIVFSLLRSWVDSLLVFYAGAALLWIGAKIPAIRSLAVAPLALIAAGAVGGALASLWVAGGASPSCASFAIVGAYLGGAVGLATHRGPPEAVA